MEHISNLNPKSGDDHKSTTGENSKIADESVFVSAFYQTLGGIPANMCVV
jgi:hypothetical protein